jgi:hypothetical protein
MFKISLNILILLGLLSVPMHDIVPHDHKHDTHIHHEEVFEEVNPIFESTHHSHQHSHYEHDFLYFRVKKSEIKSFKSFNKEFTIINLFKDNNTKSTYSQILESFTPNIQLLEFTAIGLLRAPPAFLA